MKGALALILSYIILRVSAETTESVPDGLSEEDKQSAESILTFLSCFDDPEKCGPQEPADKQADEPVSPTSQVPVDKPVFPTYDEHIRIRIENYDPTISPEEYGAIFQHQMAQGLVIKGSEDHFKPPVDTSMPKPAYLALCEDIHFKLEELEGEHPELKDLKLELLERFDMYSAQFKGTFKKGEPVVGKVLDMILEVVKQVKKDFEGKPYPPVKEPCIIDEEDITAEEDEAPYVGSVRGIPGVHYPNYTEVPITSFSCSDKHVSGFYADLETGCQVFHVCYEHRRESFLCPLGTIFNQPILACDYWYSSNCSLAPNYFDKHDKDHEYSTTEGPVTEEPEIHEEKDLEALVPFIPVKAKIVDYPRKPEEKPVVTVITGVKAVATKIFGEDIAKGIAKPKVKVVVPIEPVADKVFEDVVNTGLKAASEVRQTLGLFSKPVPGFVKVVKPHPVAKTAAIKAKFAAKSVLAAKKFPVVKTVAAAAVKLPVVKAKLAAVKVPVAKAKLAGLAATAVKVPVAKAKLAGLAATAVKVPVAKAKLAGLAATAVKVPVVKAKLAGLAATAVKVPVAKAKLAGLAAKAVKVPVAKAKLAGLAAAAVKVPVAKAKLAGLAATAVKVPVVKAKLAGLAATAVKVPVAKAKLAGLAATAVKVPVVKAKLAGLAATAVKVPVAKAKLAGLAAKAVKVPVAKAKLAGLAAAVVKVPFVKGKVAGSVAAAVKVPVVKAKLAAVKVPVVKSKVFKAAAVPFFKVKAAAKPLAKVKVAKAAAPALLGKKVVKMAPLVKVAALPVVKAKFARAAAIAPLTKKALALGYLKLLKAKKVVFMG